MFICYKIYIKQTCNIFLKVFAIVYLIVSHNFLTISYIDFKHSLYLKCEHVRKNIYQVWKIKTNE